MSLFFELSMTVLGVLSSTAEGHSYPFSEWLRFIVMMVNFALLVYLLVRFAKKPVSSGIKANREKFLEDLKKAKADKEEAERLLKEAQTKLEEADDEAKKLVQEFQMRAELLASEIIESAKLSAKKILEESQNAARAEADKVFVSMKKEIASQAVLQAEKLLRAKLSVDLDKRLVDDAIGIMEKDDRR